MNQKLVETALAEIVVFLIIPFFANYTSASEKIGQMGINVRLSSLRFGEEMQFQILFARLVRRHTNKQRVCLRLKTLFVNAQRFHVSCVEMDVKEQ